MSRHTPGTPVSGDYGSYTAEQLATLEELKDRKYTLGIVQAKYAGQVLLPNGTLVESTTTMQKHVKAALTELLSGDLTSPELLGSAQKAAQKVQEVKEHIEQKRFLFVVNADGEPIVYFQCAVKGNPDLPKLAKESDAPHLQEVRERIQSTIADAHAAAKVGVLKTPRG